MPNKRRCCFSLLLVCTCFPLLPRSSLESSYDTFPPRTNSLGFPTNFYFRLMHFPPLAFLRPAACGNARGVIRGGRRRKETQDDDAGRCRRKLVIVQESTGKRNTENTDPLRGKKIFSFPPKNTRDGGRASASRNFALQQGFCIFRSLFFPHTRLSSFLPYFSSPLSSSSFGTLKAMGKAGRREKQTDRRTHERELQYTAKAVAH